MNNTPSVNPDPSVLIVSGDVEDKLNEAYVLALKHALEIIHDSDTMAEAVTRILTLKEKSC